MIQSQPLPLTPLTSSPSYCSFSDNSSPLSRHNLFLANSNSFRRFQLRCYHLWDIFHRPLPTKWIYPLMCSPVSPNPLCYMLKRPYLLIFYLTISSVYTDYVLLLLNMRINGMASLLIITNHTVRANPFEMIHIISHK